MANINFDDDNTTPRPQQPSASSGGLTGFVEDKFNLGKNSAKKVLAAVGIIAFLISLYFWLQILL